MKKRRAPKRVPLVVQPEPATRRRFFVTLDIYGNERLEAANIELALRVALASAGVESATCSTGEFLSK